MKKLLLLFITAVLAALLLAGCAQPSPPATDQAPEAEPTAEPAPAPAEEAEPVDEPLQPIYADQLADGAYAIEVSSSSSMFRIVDTQLTVSGGEMFAVLTLNGTGYEKLYMGTGAQAEADTDDKCIYFVEDSEGKYTYTVPVTALDQDTDVAAWSIRKKTWYDRVLVFQSALIPSEAFSR